MADVTSKQVWDEIERRIYGVLAFVTPKGEARTAGIVYQVDRGRLYITTDKTSWKSKHIASNPHVAVTIGIPKRIPFMPWIQIPDASISFHGTARLIEVAELRASILRKLMGKNAAGARRGLVVIEVTPRGRFATYGIGVSALGMRDHDNAAGRCPVSR